MVENGSEPTDSLLNHAMGNLMLTYWARQLYVMDPVYRKSVRELREQVIKNQITNAEFMERFKTLIKEALKRQSKPPAGLFDAIKRFFQ